MSSLISVIVPVYNVEAYLVRCVDSILCQTYGNLEVILVNDGSKDSSGSLCDALAAKDSRVKVLHKENGGLSSARNAGIDLAKGDYLAFVDSDDWIEPEAYERMLALLEKYQAKMVCAGRYDFDSETGEKTIGLCPEKEELISGEEFAGRIFTWDHVDSAACDKLYEKSLFDGIRYPIGKICEDVPVTYRLALRAGKVAMCSEPFYNYYHRPGSITTAQVSEKNFHLSEHTAKIYEEICRDYPALKDRAAYLRVRSLVHPMQLLDIADGETRKKFAEKYRSLRRDLRQFAGILLKSPHFSRREKLEAMLLCTGTYRPLQRLYHRVRG